MLLWYDNPNSVNSQPYAACGLPPKPVRSAPASQRNGFSVAKEGGHKVYDLFRGLEITTGGRRLNEYRMLLDNLEMFGLKPEGLADYLSIFKYGCPPHGGFAIGLERLTRKVLGLANVKEAFLLPRDRRRVRP